MAEYIVKGDNRFHSLVEVRSEWLLLINYNAKLSCPIYLISLLWRNNSSANTTILLTPFCLCTCSCKPYLVKNTTTTITLLSDVHLLNDVLYQNEGSPPSSICNRSLLWSSCLGSLVYLILKSFKMFGFQIVRLWTYPMKVIPKTRGPHTIGYLCFYYVNCHPFSWEIRLIVRTFVLIKYII
jgi:hypothetical protein